jgi:SAM-dependent methyltransferase
MEKKNYKPPFDYVEENTKTIDHWIEAGWEWGIPISSDTFLKAKQGEWEVVLTPTKAMPKSWFPPSIKGLKLLGLASGGGQQMPIFAALGAEVTVLDYSLKQLESERLVAAREGYHIEIVRADMTKRLPFDDNTFDIIFHPVSNSYVEQVKPIFKECYRILKPGGIFIGGYDNGINYISDDEHTITNRFPFNPLVNPDQMKALLDSDNGVQFSHTLAEQIGGQLEAGFILTHLYEDINSEGHLHDLNVPCFFATRAIKRE